MSDLTEAQRTALAGLLALCPRPLLTQVDSMAASLSGARADTLRQLAAEEARNRHRLDLMLQPLEPLFHPRADGLEGLSFPAAIRRRLWSLTITHEPNLLRQLDRGDQVSRTVADRLCLTAAMAVRDHAKSLWPEATADQIETLAGCLDLAGILRRHMGHMEAWLRGGTAQATADLKQMMVQARAVDEKGPGRLLEILFAHCAEARLFPRLLGQILPLVGHEVEEADVHRFTRRLIEAAAERCEAVAEFDVLAEGADMKALRDSLHWAAGILGELDAQTLVRPDAAGGKLLRQARQRVSDALSRHFLKAEQLVVSLLPVEQTVMAGRMKRPMPRLDRPLDEADVAQAKAFLAVVAVSLGPAMVFGREADRKQTAEGLTWRLASWADEALEQVHEGVVGDADLAMRRIGMAADLLALIDAREAARSIRRRLMALVHRSEQLAAATTEASPLMA